MADSSMFRRLSSEKSCFLFEGVIGCGNYFLVGGGAIWCVWSFMGANVGLTFFMSNRSVLRGTLALSTGCYCVDLIR